MTPDEVRRAEIEIDRALARQRLFRPVLKYPTSPHPAPPCPGQPALPDDLTLPPAPIVDRAGSGRTEGRPESTQSLRVSGQGQRLDSKGYVLVRFPQHPLARRDGDVLEHRMVLYDTIGRQDHPCYWCGFMLPWQSEQQPAWKHAICVDHLNEDRQDNRVTNLVPACWYCNANRSWSRVAPRVWRQALEDLGPIPPNDRPPAILWLAEQAEARW